jgi:teichuronic acid biosynthesis glycosyltransferase TuaG
MSKYIVSVIIPYFKKKKYIIKTLNSIFNQTFKHFEVILIIDKKDKKIGEYIIEKKIDYKKLIKSCDIGLSTVILKRKILTNIKFSSMKTKEDYLVWLQLIKKEKFFYGTEEILASWRKTDKSLSSFFFQKIVDAYYMYNYKLKHSYTKSLYFVLRLSFYALLKKLKIFF